MRKTRKLAIALSALLTTFTMLAASACVLVPSGSSSSSEAPTESSSSQEASSEEDSSDEASSEEDSSDVTSSEDSSEDSSSSEPTVEKIEIPASNLKMTAETELGTAEASWFITYGESSLDFTVYVKDAIIYKTDSIYGNDSVEVRIAKVQNVAGYSDGAISVLADAAGNVEVKNLSTNTQMTDSGVTVDLKEFSLDGDKVDGYLITIKVPYAATEVTAADKDAAVCLGFVNADDPVALKGYYDGTYGADEDSVKTYMMVTDDNTYEENIHLRQKIDVLFAGDSYIEWWKHDNVYESMVGVYGMEDVNIGVGGTRIENWAMATKVEELRLTYMPKQVVFNIGVNDIDDANQTADETADELKAMYDAYHVAFPTAELYWVGLIPNNAFAQHNAKYAEVNADLSAYAEANDWFTYIDMWNLFCEEGATGADGTAITPRANMFRRNDGLHLNVEYGYPLWGSTILEALGYERAHGTVMGDNEAGRLAYSPGWTVDTENNQVENTGTLEQVAYFGAYGPSADLYFEVDFTAPELAAPDAYPKAGLILRNDDVTVFAYFDLVDSTMGNVCIVYRPNTAAGCPDDWMWGAQAPGATTNADIMKDYVNVAIAKFNDTVYMFVNGKVATQMKVPNLTAESTVVAGVLGFNMKMAAKNATGTNVESEVEYKLLSERTVSIADYEGVTAEFNRTTAKKGDTISFTLTTTGAPVESVSVSDGSTSTPLTADENGAYSFVMPDSNVSIVVTFAGLLSVDLSAVEGKVVASTMTPYAGAEVTFEETDSAAIVALYVNGVELLPVDGVYSIVANENLVVTGEFNQKIDGIVLDGQVDTAYGTVSTTAYYNDNRDVTVYGVKTSAGLFVNVVAHVNTVVSDAAEWWNNTNMEFYLNGGAQRFVNIKGENNGVTAFKWNVIDPTEEGGKKEVRVEFFVEKTAVNGWTDDGSIQFNYAWKTGGEGGRIVSDAIHPWVLNADMDWWCFHRIGGCWNDAFAPQRVDNLRIGSNGLEIKTAQNATIDGNLSEYEGLTSVSAGDAAKANFTLTGKAAEDGLYLAITLYHGAWSTANTADWAANDNLEFRINQLNTGIVFMEGRLVLPGHIAEGVAVTTEVEGRNVTTIELFYPGNSDSYRVQVGIAGAGFGGWQSAIWDGAFAFISANGAQFGDNIGDVIAANGITLDGDFNEAVWTESVKAKTYSGERNGATVQFMGVNTRAGVLLGFTVTHTKHHVQEAGDAWWHYMGPEIRLAGVDYQIAASTFNGGTGINCQVSAKTVEGENGVLTTTFEMLVPYHALQRDMDDSFGLAIAGVFETGFGFITADGWGVHHYVTADGIVQ